MGTTTLTRSDSDGRSTFTPFLIYVVAFHVVWIAWPYVLYPRLTATLGATTLTYALVQLSIRILLWVVPVVLYLRHVDGVDPSAYLKLTQRIRRGVLVGVAVTLLNALGMIARFGLPHVTLARVTWNSVLGTSLLVGVIEEIPYRGFMLQKFAERVGFPLATVITSVLFVAIHLPGWLALHILRADTVATIFVFGLVMAVVFKYADSLWAPIVAHSANDFLSFVVYRL